MNTEWDASQYLKFENQRNQPISDLLNRIKEFTPEYIVDIGCGPGNSTIRVQHTFPHAHVTGIDSSDDMISRAQKAYPNLNFSREDVHELSGIYDMIFSNACLQWIPNHKTLIPELLTKLHAGGVFAAQIPMNGKEPLFQIIEEVVSDPKWGFQNVHIDYNGTLSPNEYFDLLSGCCDSFQIWETKYYHNLPDHHALIEWIKGSKIRPYLAHLPKERQADFENEILERTREAYPVMQNGEVILC